MVSAEAFVDIFWTDCSVASLEIQPFLINIKPLRKDYWNFSTESRTWLKQERIWDSLIHWWSSWYLWSIRMRETALTKEWSYLDSKAPNSMPLPRLGKKNGWRIQSALVIIIEFDLYIWFVDRCDKQQLRFAESWNVELIGNRKKNYSDLFKT